MMTDNEYLQFDLSNTYMIEAYIYIYTLMQSYKRTPSIFMLVQNIKIS